MKITKQVHFVETFSTFRYRKYNTVCGRERKKLWRGAAINDLDKSSIFKQCANHDNHIEMTNNPYFKMSSNFRHDYDDILMCFFSYTFYFYLFIFYLLSNQSSIHRCSNVSIASLSSYRGYILISFDFFLNALLVYLHIYNIYICTYK